MQTVLQAPPSKAILFLSTGFCITQPVGFASTDGLTDFRGREILTFSLTTSLLLSLFFQDLFFNANQKTISCFLSSLCLFFLVLWVVFHASSWLNSLPFFPLLVYFCSLPFVLSCCFPLSFLLCLSCIFSGALSSLFFVFSSLCLFVLPIFVLCPLWCLPVLCLLFFLVLPFPLSVSFYDSLLSSLCSE